MDVTNTIDEGPSETGLQYQTTSTTDISVAKWQCQFCDNGFKVAYACTLFDPG